ncbi:MAG: hypothetical protein ABR615_07675 [Pseudonocardiaceae bacterium]
MPTPVCPGPGLVRGSRTWIDTTPAPTLFRLFDRKVSRQPGADGRRGEAGRLPERGHDRDTARRYPVK